VYRRFKPANVLRGLAANNVNQYSCFRSKLVEPEGESPASRSKPQQRTVTGRPSLPSVILFIALTKAKDNIDPG
jgi:hypothetical protein